MVPGFDEADRPALLAALEYQRASVRSIVDGLSEEDWHTSVVPSGWTPAGLVTHLGGAERHWTCDVILADDPGHPFDEDFGDEPYDPDAPFVIDWASSKVLTYYRDQARQTDQMLAVTALDAAPRGRHGTAAGDQPMSVREIVLHLIEETAAHSGHLEIARELLDGKTRLGLR
ncbi:DinB family protein [Leekyejoonella antrihumi]|uniref:DinB family protein n=1 Tax=Leekyejoonella antrihumi TaxID=1660198 RepID=A0A563DUS2_9MICO|nr:DinB family protein [Leekyejoonella antrihumi]TWP33662.1 DinB family protein [Leekyejoonella antrihumi]